ncbi:hypothetical protein C5167_035068 [Papaver somniferum]|uniref:Uncharacterized protein n=1 Tax=Papaver somniferum TaxID=3469 RepID=A0A4Y7KEL6_PAPSO|nr:hypothetical protein C5167_035068 [Papaver somniferum]
MVAFTRAICRPGPDLRDSGAEDGVQMEFLFVIVLM